MQGIEPELTSAGRKLSADTYKNETPDQHAQRMKRYDIAFERCNQAYEDYMRTLSAQVNRYRRDSFGFVEAKVQTEEASALDALSAFIHGFAG